MAEQRLWAPWRMQYIRGDKSGECIFCAAARSGDDAGTHVVRRGERCFVMLNAYPYTSGHFMVSPYRHVGTIEDLDAAEWLDMMTLAREGVAALRAAYRPDGFNLGINQGKVAGAGFDDHIHLHVVPRWEADSNFMAVTGNARVLPQTLDDTLTELRNHWPA
jgi:ATP adenylyltransferase